MRQLLRLCLERVRCLVDTVLAPAGCHEADFSPSLDFPLTPVAWFSDDVAMLRALCYILLLGSEADDPTASNAALIAKENVGRPRKCS